MPNKTSNVLSHVRIAHTSRHNPHPHQFTAYTMAPPPSKSYDYSTGPRPAWQNEFFPDWHQGSQSIRIASELDLHRLATIALCNVPRHDEDRWMRQNFQRTNLARLTGDLNSLIIKIRARIMDPRYIVAVVYDESTDPETEWGQANMCKPLWPAVGNIVLGSRPMSKGDLTIVGFIIVDKEPLDANMDTDVDPLAGMPPFALIRGKMKRPQSLRLHQNSATSPAERTEVFLPILTSSSALR